MYDKTSNLLPITPFYAILPSVVLTRKLALPQSSSIVSSFSAISATSSIPDSIRYPYPSSSPPIPSRLPLSST